jgi:ubiquinol-cytochrome c reductase cytochrome c1 subunit
MVRPIAFLVGLFFAGMLVYSGIRGAIVLVTEPTAKTAEKVFHKHPRHVDWSFNGPLGKFDQAQLQRGFQVYKEVCAACHGLKLVSFRDLQSIGYTEGQVKTIATEWAIETPTVNPETGEPATRKSIPADKIPSNFANDTAARAANNNALPPDLSLITKARHNGPDYVYSLLTGYVAKQPAELVKQFPDSEIKKGSTLHYNPYFANLNIAMAPPIIANDQVTYGEGAPKATVDQMAKDVSAFLTWTAEPKLEVRKQTGLAVFIFLLAFTWLAWMSYQNIWSEKKKKA